MKALTEIELMKLVDELIYEKSSGNLEITIKNILAQIDILPKIYSKDQVISTANKL